jgi:S1-C subfamily serine protease
MNRKKFGLTAAIGCVVMIALLVIVTVGVFFSLPQVRLMAQTNTGESQPPPPAAEETQAIIPTFTAPAPLVGQESTSQTISSPSMPAAVESVSLTALYQQVNPGVVNIQVYVEQGTLSGQGAGSGFVLDDQGHIVTNNHVVADAQQVTVIFYNKIEAEAEVIGTDPGSDLAVIRVAELPESVHQLPLGNSDEVQVGEWVIAIGNPFGQQSSMSLGIVSAVERTIPTGITPFAIPQAIQTDAAINPGNSGGPLLNLRGEIIGVNAQIATGGALANAGVGFAIPANVVRRVAPVLIENGSYQWPWLGVEGGDLNFVLSQANDLEIQQGAYIDRVVRNSPAAEAGLQGTSGLRQIDGLDVPVGGDVVVEADGQPVTSFSDLLAHIALKQPDDNLALIVLREGRRQNITVELAPRPSNFGGP